MAGFKLNIPLWTCLKMKPLSFNTKYKDVYRENPNKQPPWLNSVDRNALSSSSTQEGGLSLHYSMAVEYFSDKCCLSQGKCCQHLHMTVQHSGLPCYQQQRGWELWQRAWVPFPIALNPSSGGWRGAGYPTHFFWPPWAPQAHMWYTNKYTGKTYIHIKNKSK